MPNVAIARKARLSPFRHIALGTWRTAYDPSIYGSLTLRMQEALRYLHAYRSATGRHLTVTHMMAKVVGHMLEQMPELNAILRWRRIYLRKDISVFFQVAIEDPETGELDLSGIKVEEPQTKTLATIIDEFESRAAAVRARRDEGLERSRSQMGLVPAFAMHAALRVLSFLSYTLNLDLHWAGIPRDAFGSVMVSNVGSLGLEAAYAPLVPFSRVPLLVAMGAVEDIPEAIDGQVQVATVMRLFATFDHRVLDGAHAARMVKIMRAWFEQPFDHFEAIPSESAAVHEATNTLGSPSQVDSVARERT